MKIIKIAAVLASSFLTALFILIFTVENPETALYKEKIEKLKSQTGIYSEDELEIHFPVLIEIKTKLGRITELKQTVLNKIKSPAPIITEEETLQLEYYNQLIRQLRKEIRSELFRLAASYANGQKID